MAIPSPHTIARLASIVPTDFHMVRIQLLFAYGCRQASDAAVATAKLISTAKIAGKSGTAMAAPE